MKINLCQSKFDSNTTIQLRLGTELHTIVVEKTKMNEK